MKIKLFISTVLFSFLAFSAFAQCGSNHKRVKSDYHERHNDIINIASNNHDFTTLVAAIKVAGLVETLQSDGPFTVFAPTNTAFDKLPEGTVKSLLEPGAKDQLTKILTYHVVAGEFKAKDVIAAINASGGSFTIKTVSGDKLVATMNGNSVILTDENGGVSAVTKTDLDATNGVIHVIDSVILPK